MIKNSLLVAATLALCCPAAYAQTSGGGVITPPETKSDGSVITPPAVHADPGIQKSPDMGTNQSQLPKSDTNPRSGGMKGPGGVGPGAQAPETPSAPAPGTGSGSTR